MPSLPAATTSPVRTVSESAEPREDRAQQPRERIQGKGRDGDKGRDNKDRGKFGGGRDKGGRDKGGRDRDKGGRDSGPSHRQYATSAAPRERDRPVDHLRARGRQPSSLPRTSWSSTSTPTRSTSVAGACS